MPPPPNYASPRYDVPLYPRQGPTSQPDSWNWRATASDEALVLESWSEGFMVGALVIMACITIANMRRGVLLHKLILAELFLAMFHGTFCFMSFKGYGWYLSSTAALLYISWIVHNVVAWMKVRPFFSQPGGFFRPKLGDWAHRIYMGTLALTVPVILFQISNNFRFFNNRGGWYTKVRPYEPLFRDPWWIFTVISFLIVITRCYGTGIFGLVMRSPRFGVLLMAMCVAIVFTICDIAASATTFVGTSSTSTDGINPWWKLALVFKCLTDTILLDDFKTELKRLGVKRIVKEEKRRNSMVLVLDRNPSGAFATSSDKFEVDPVDGQISSKKRRESWFSGRSPMAQFPVPLQHSENEMCYSPITHPLKNSNALLQPSKDLDASSDDMDFNTALALGPPSPSQHIEYANKRGKHMREHLNNTKTKLSQLPSLHEFKFEAIKPGKRSRKQHSDEYHDALKDTNSPPANSEAEDEATNPLSSLEPLSWTQGVPRNQDELMERSQLYHQEMAKMRDKNEDEQWMRERRFRQSIGVG